jgi:hypothetical protein
MVLTSPPYYNLELLGTPKGSKEEWNALYTTIFLKNAYDGLQTGGHFVINIRDIRMFVFRTL